MYQRPNGRWAFRIKDDQGAVILFGHEPGYETKDQAAEYAKNLYELSDLPGGSLTVVQILA